MELVDKKVQVTCRGFDYKHHGKSYLVRTSEHQMKCSLCGILDSNPKMKEGK